MDISSKSAGFEISEKFGETPDGKWVAKNAYQYGFIIRYPKGKKKTSRNLNMSRGTCAMLEKKQQKRCMITT